MKIKDYVVSMLVGIGIGIPVTLICMISLGGWNTVIREFLVWTVASALFGVLSVLFFENDRLNAFLSTALHCVGCLGITLGACAINGYGEKFLDLLLAIVPVFVVVYAAIYAITFFSMRKSAKQANEAINKK